VALNPPNFEIAYLNWPSKEAHDKAFATEAGKSIFADGSQFMDTLMYAPAEDIKPGAPVIPGHFYKTVK
jgi:hypothetical protein